MTVRPALSWSGGKDSALTLWTLRREGVEPAALITTVTEEYERISMHGVRRELLARQAAAAGVPLVEVRIPPACINDIYEHRMAEAFACPSLSDVEAVAFGDLFLEDVRAYREQRLTANDRRGLFPLWGRDTADLAREFIAAGFQAKIVPMTSRCSPTCPRASIRVVRTGSSTPSSMPDRSSPNRSRVRPARSSSARGLSSAMC
jgi:diphthamide synthase (EF-2-diphthine--ammonia ligase)